MKKSGRPNKYDSDVKPRFAEIKEWLQIGATDREIADNLGINKATMCEYKKKYSEFNELIKSGRKQPVQAIKAALFKRATGFSYTEQTITDSEKNGRTIQTYQKYALPDPASAMILLKHWDKENEWTNDPASLELKKKELEYKKEMALKNEW